jgi:hypothetical protein
VRPATMPAAERWEHGTRTRYVAGCRCAHCRAANTQAARERAARAKAAALASPAAAQKGQPCPGVNGAPCRRGVKLRKDSIGGMCEKCREQLVFNGLVDACAVRDHLRALSRQGVGYRQTADAAGVASSVLAKVLNGERTQIRASTARRVLEVTAEAAADHAMVSAGPTKRRLRRLIAEGFTHAELARRLGYKRPALQLGRERVLAKTQHKIKRFYDLVMAI